MTTPETGLLETILAATRETLRVREAAESRAEVERRALARPARPGAFRAALMRDGQPNIIAECKRRSPSKGVLRAEYDPVAIARAYAAAGAAAISVLTEPAFFDGDLAHLAAVRAAVDLPLLRKDFIVSEYQLLEARAAGADAVLLIVSALSPALLRELYGAATSLGLDVLVEVHNDAELSAAMEADVAIIGVNNRDLRTLSVDVAASDRLVRRIPPDVVAVSESGLRQRADIERLSGLGYSAFLIGERLMTAEDPGAALRTLLAQD